MARSANAQVASIRVVVAERDSERSALDAAARSQVAQEQNHETVARGLGPGLESAATLEVRFRSP